MCMCVYTCRHAHTCTDIQTNIYTNHGIHTYIHTHYTYTHTYIHTYIHIQARLAQQHEAVQTELEEARRGGEPTAEKDTWRLELGHEEVCTVSKMYIYIYICMYVGQIVYWKRIVDENVCVESE